MPADTKHPVLASASSSRETALCGSITRFHLELAAQARSILWRETGCDLEDHKTWTRPEVRVADQAGIARSCECSRQESGR